MSVRSSIEELQAKEQQADLWEEKLAQRAQGLADSARGVLQRRTLLSQSLEELKSVGLKSPDTAIKALQAEPALSSNQTMAIREEAFAARHSAVEARLRAAQAWEEDLTRQANSLSQTLQSLTTEQGKVQQAVQIEHERRRKDLQAHAAARPPEAVKLVSARNAPIPRSTPRLPGSEHRVHERAQLSVQVDFESDHNFFTGFSADISEGGIFVATVNLQPLGSPIEVAFALPTGEQVVARGSVRWLREPNNLNPALQSGMGVQFEALSEEARDAVHRFISQRDPIFYED